MLTLKLKTRVFSSLLAAVLLSPIGNNKCFADNDSALDRMISPVTNPVNFEDPRPTTEIRPIFLYHEISDDFVTGGGDIQLLAAQVRFALSDRLGIIATKDGYIQINSDEALNDSEGSANLAAGIKYALHRDDQRGRIATVGLRYELATGSPDVFQGQGDGIVSPFVSAAAALGPINVMGSTQLRLALDDDDSSLWDLSLHADYPINNFYPLVEVNLVNVVDAGERIGLKHEGFDLVNFGSSASDGSTVVTAGVGARYRVCDFADIGAAYELAVTDREDIFDWRVTTDIILRMPT